MDLLFNTIKTLRLEEIRRNKKKPSVAYAEKQKVDDKLQHFNTVKLMRS